MSILTIKITSNTTYDRLNSILDLKASDRRRNLSNIAKLLDGMGSGMGSDFTSGTLKSMTSGSCTLVLTGLPTAADTFVLNGVTFTARASGAVANEYNIGATATATATAIAASINASVTAGVAGNVTATSSAGTVTITAVYPDAITYTGGLTNYSLSESMANTTATAWALDSNASTVTL